MGRVLGVSSRTIARWEEPSSIPSAAQRKLLWALLVRTGIGADGNGAGNAKIDGLSKKDSKLLEELHKKEMENLTPENLQDAISRLQELLKKKELASPNRHVLRDERDAPSWYRKITKRLQEEDWEFVVDFGEEFVTRPLKPYYKVRFLIRLSVGKFRMGQGVEAVDLAKKALTICEDPPLKSLIYANLAAFYIRQGRLEESNDALLKSVALFPGRLETLYNSLILASARKSEAACNRAARELLLYHPDAGDPRSLTGKGILGDPDLGFFRTTKSFRKVFPDIASKVVNKRPTKPTSSRFRKGAKLAAILLLLMGLGSGFAASYLPGHGGSMHAAVMTGTEDLPELAVMTGTEERPLHAAVMTGTEDLPELAVMTGTETSPLA
jgi:tetratricopeptide (TPR) repeat protein